MVGQTRILVIDDDHRIIDTTEAILKAEGYKVDTAETGKEAIAKSEKTFYNIALVDIRLPDYIPSKGNEKPSPSIRGPLRGFQTSGEVVTLPLN